MNVLSEEQRLLNCPACGDTFRFKRRACLGQCLRGGAHSFIDGARHDSGREPHLHVECSECGFVWLEVVAHPQVLEKVL